MSDEDLKGLLADAVGRLSGAGVGSPQVDAQMLAAHVLGISRARLAAGVVTGAARFTGDQERRFLELVGERANRVPLQHLTGIAYFRHLELRVGPGVFVPRPETETLVQLGIDAVSETGSHPLLVDLCTGSAAVAIALATEVPGARVIGVEKSEHAIAWARVNRDRYAAAVSAAGSGLDLIAGDAAVALPELDGTVDAVVANPPYIPDAAVPRDPEVRDHDPALALYGGADGLRIPGLIAGRAAGLLRDGGFFAMEHGEEQGAAVRDLLAAAGSWEAVATVVDPAGRDRVTRARRVVRASGRGE